MWFAFLIVAFIALSLLIGLLFYLMDEPWPTEGHGRTYFSDCRRVPEDD